MERLGVRYARHYKEKLIDQEEGTRGATSGLDRPVGANNAWSMLLWTGVASSRFQEDRCEGLNRAAETLPRHHWEP
jgi:hypothetical protein